MWVKVFFFYYFFISLHPYLNLIRTDEVGAWMFHAVSLIANPTDWQKCNFIKSI